MKYFVLEITTINGSTAKAIWEHSTLEAAKSQYYGILSSAYANEDITYGLYQIINEQGFCHVMERIPEITEEEE